MLRSHDFFLLPTRHLPSTLPIIMSPLLCYESIQSDPQRLTKPNEVEVRAGSRRLGEGMVIPIDSITVPKDFDAREHYMDIAVLRTSTPFTFSRELKPTFLAAVNSELPDTITVAGWGTDGISNDLSEELRFVNLPVISNLQCQTRYPESSITRHLFCAENTRVGGQGTCKGDGGAPATMTNTTRLVGISSFARGCGFDIAPSVFTNVNNKEIRDFIDSNTKKNISENSTVIEQADARIAGGEIPEEEENNFSYQVQILIRNTKFCSGAIIERYYILTAAHCVDKTKPNEVEVRAGSRRLGEGMVIPIDSIMVPKDFDAREHYMDIAVLRTSTPFTFSRELKPTFLAAVNSDLPDSVTVAGWGTDGISNDLSEELRFVNLPVISNLQCQARYPESGITRNLFCAENIRQGGQGTCKGDGGAPAVMENSRRLAGISTFARGCGFDIAPSVFTNVDNKEIRDFIDSNTSDKGDNFLDIYDDFECDEDGTTDYEYACLN
ncbi:jg10826 [Pararge aegeria aegeria]|uniref:Jg10826 protein n=1 Tax=Pararge aegeria aegeria TaxID=348720 RepID=A0A8S4QIT1_9NEOP|nr:jg10826 [Pararge aegeria aegeria]